MVLFNVQEYFYFYFLWIKISFFSSQSKLFVSVLSKLNTNSPCTAYCKSERLQIVQMRLDEIIKIIWIKSKTLFSFPQHRILKATYNPAIQICKCLLWPRKLHQFQEFFIRIRFLPFSSTIRTNPKTIQFWNVYRFLFTREISNYMESNCNLHRVNLVCIKNGSKE